MTQRNLSYGGGFWKVPERLEEISFESLFLDMSPPHSLKMQVKAKGDEEASSKDQRIELEKPDSEEPEVWRRLLEGEISLQEYLGTGDFPPAQQDDSEVEEDVFWDCSESLQDFSRAADDADQLPGGQWANESMPSVSGEGPGAQRSRTSSGTDDISEHFPVLAQQSEPKVPVGLEKIWLVSLVRDLSDSLKLEVKAKDKKAGLKAQRTELEKPGSAKSQQQPRRRSLEVPRRQLEKHDSGERKPRRRSLEGGRETHLAEVGFPGNWSMSPSPEKIKRPNEDLQSSREISLQEPLNTVESTQAEQGNSEVVKVCFEGFQPGGQSAAERMPGVSGEAQRCSTTSETKDNVTYITYLFEGSELTVPVVEEEMSFDSPFWNLSPSVSLKMEVKAKDRKAGLNDKRTKLEKHDSAEPKPWRRSLESGRETEVGSLDDLQMSPSPEKIKRPNEGLQSSRGISLQESLSTVESPHAEQGKSQVAEDCFKGFQPEGQSAAESMPGISEEAPGAQRSHTSSGTEDIVEYFPFLFEQSEPKALEELSLDSLFLDPSPSDSLTMEVKAGLKDHSTELEKHDLAKPEPRRRSLESGRETEVQSLGNWRMGPSPEKIKRPNEDLQPSREISLQESLNTVESPQAEQGNSQVAEVCLEGFQPRGQPAAENMPDVSGEAPGAQRSSTTSETKDIVKQCKVLVEKISVDSYIWDLRPSDSLRKGVKVKGDRKPGSKGVGPASEGEKDNNCLRRSEQSHQTRGSPHEEEVITFKAAEIEEVPKIHQSLEICARVDPGRRDSLTADKRLSEATCCVRKMTGTECGESSRQSSDPLQSPLIQQITEENLCLACGRSCSCSSSSNLSKHKKTNTGEKPYPCSVCGKKFRTHSRLLDHKRIHTGEKPYKCSECGKSYSTSSHLSTHKLFHSEEKPYKCSKCGKNFRTSHDLSVHKQIHAEHNLKKCTVCGKTYSSVSSLSRHKRSHKEKNPYKCSVCGKSYSSSSALESHKHTHTGEKPFKCSVCGKCFRSSPNFLAHQQTHKRTKPYKCFVCKEIFISHSALSEHRQLHTEKRYQCAVCDRRFGTSSNLSRHQRIHTGEKLYKCPECGKCFGDSSSLLRHKQSHAGEKPYKCPECGKSYCRKSIFEKHMKRSHNLE